MSQQRKWSDLLLALCAAGSTAAIGSRTAQATPAVGLTVGNALIRFDTRSPGTLSAGPAPITGLQSGERLLGIDFRPATGVLYGVGSSGRLYTINLQTGVATPGAVLSADPTDTTAPFSGLAGTEFGVDFNATSNRLRVVSDAEQNLRINVDSGLVITDGPLAFASGDANAGDNPAVTAAAYTNSFAGATSTTLYDIDTFNDALVIQNPANAGTLATVGPLGIGDVSAVTGFDILPGSNQAFATVTGPGNPNSSLLSQINLATGAATAGTAIGPAGTGVVRGLAFITSTTVGFSSANYTVNEGAGTVNIPVFRTGNSTTALTVNYSTADGSAMSPFDYQATSGTLTFAPGQTIAVISVPITLSTIAEGTETFTITLSAPSGPATALSTATATVSIIDASAPPASSPTSTIFALTVNNRLFSFAASDPGTITGSVNITGLQTGEAVLGIDFRPANGLLYALGSSNRLYTIDTVTGAATQVGAAGGFALSGGNFGFNFNPASDLIRVTSDAEQNLRLDPNTGALAATDGALTYAPNDVNEGANPEIVGLSYTNPDNAPGTGTTLYDIDATAGTLVLQNPPNAGTLTTIGPLGFDPSSLVGFDIAQGNTAFAALAAPGDFMRLFSISLATGQATSRGQINIPEAVRAIAVAPAGTVALSATPTSVVEGAGSVPVTITRTGAGAAAVTVTLSNGTAQFGSDFGGPLATRVTFAPGELSKTITVPIVNDGEHEADETFNVTLSDPENLTLASPSTYAITIVDDDPVRTVSIGNAEVKEGNSGTANATFTVSLLSPSAQPVTVSFATADGTATAPADYASTSGTLTFAPGETSKSITVAVNGDTIAEGNETFVVNLSNVVGAAVGTAQGTGTILDDDVAALTLSIDKATVTEGGTATGTVTRNTPSTSDLVVSLLSNDLTEATVPATVTIPAGQTSATFTITSLNDLQVDGSQNVMITAASAGLASATASLVVADNGQRANTAPVAVADSYRTRGHVISVARPGVLRNDTDAEHNPLQAILVQRPAHGTLRLNPDGSFLYRGVESYTGTDTFTYVASDGKLKSVPVTVTLNVGPARDSTPPFVSFSGGARRVVSRLPGVRGLATDVTAVAGRGGVFASGLRGVSLRLQRGDGQYFNGRAFQRAPFDFPAPLIGRAFFSLDSALPSAALTPDGSYLYTAIATDLAGNVSRAQQLFIVDTIAPTVTITTPPGDASNVSHVTSLNVISGRVLGASTVMVALRRADNFYFNGSTYQSAPFFFSAPVISGMWTISVGLPVGANLPPGRYVIDARARDEAGNSGGTTRTVLVESAPAG